jgi:hypothetical protein
MRISDSFKLFNPLWLVQNIFTTHLQPMLIGAGVGALSSAAMGKSPFTGALLGGATGGVFGGSESLLGGKIADAFGQSAIGNTVGGVSQGIQATGGAIPSVGVTGFGQGAQLLDKLPYADVAGSVGNLGGSWNIGQGALPATTASGAYAGGIPISAGDLASGGGANISKLFNYTPPTALEKIQGVGTDAYSWAKDNPLSAGNIGLKGIELANQPPKPVDTSGQRPIKQGSFEGGAGIQMPTPAATGVSPTILPVRPNKTGQVALDSVVQRHPELIQLYPSLFGGR